ncbi:MAG TPA: hypothetical protein VI653_21145, partial [Steroidobacteraceae bacterium]
STGHATLPRRGHLQRATDELTRPRGSYRPVDPKDLHVFPDLKHFNSLRAMQARDARRRT